MKKLAPLALGAGLAVAAVTWVAAQTLGASDPLTAQRMGSWGYDTTGGDKTVAPGDDFYRYAAGGWTDKLEIPADRTRWGSFDVLLEVSNARAQAIIEAAGGQAGSPAARQVGDYYTSFMDEAAVEALGAKPLARDLAAIRAADTRPKIAALMGRVADTFHGGFFAPFIADDQKVPGRYAVYLSQAGLGLPDRDYYLAPQFAAQRTAYRDYIARTLRLVGWADAGARADEILALETRIAEASWTLAERRDDLKMYNPKTPAELQALAPGFPWDAYLKAAGLGEHPRFVVGEVTAFPKIAAIFGETPIPTLQAWQAFTTTDSASPYLSKAFVDSRFDFRGKTLSGQPENRPRWKRAVASTDDHLGESVGRLYVEKYFPPESKAQMEALVKNLLVAMKGRIERLDWMSAETKKEALTKLSKMNVKIGYPNKWRDYSGLRIARGDLYGNVERGLAFDWDYQRGKLSKPVDRDEWFMTPQTVNAYFSPTKNEIVFPAAILQPPFFDPLADPAVNYGAIGAVIGHEITHAFDDQGRQSDGEGQLRDWWTTSDAALFGTQADRLKRQYEAFEPLPGLHINGSLTMGENIADLGGVLVAYDAYMASLGGKPAPVIDGYTGAQRFFLAYAQVWRGKIRDDALRQQLVSDPHSPGVFRANGTVRNVDAWYAAFDVKPGQKMYVAPEDRVRIW
jgi:putative endopeptidase